MDDLPLAVPRLDRIVEFAHGHPEGRYVLGPTHDVIAGFRNRQGPEGRVRAHHLQDALVVDVRAHGQLQGDGPLCLRRRGDLIIEHRPVALPAPGRRFTMSLVYGDRNDIVQ
ncbi:hypothetical protein D3C85_1604700 [compost metagenome]